MSKKETEFDRYDRMKKLQQQADFQKKKSMDSMQEEKIRGGKTRFNNESYSRDWSKDYDFTSGDTILD